MMSKRGFAAGYFAREICPAATRLLFTQEYVAEMLGVGRTSVTTTAHTIQRAGMIKHSRGKIQILDVDALRDTACECYETVNSNYRASLAPLFVEEQSNLQS
jgi:hypothetical protein